MNNIINAKTRFKSGIEFDGCEYTIDEDANFGVRALSKDMELYKDKNGFHLKSKGGRKERQALAEFLWVAVTLIDSEEKYKPDMDMIGIDYKRISNNPQKD